ncbi:MAG: hypothetical protein QMD06_01185 [Candidatus Altarchaeum sp.]|nr:hypothetical protein [Candidatus Altarchaeum sp.]
MSNLIGKPIMSTFIIILGIIVIGIIMLVFLKYSDDYKGVVANSTTNYSLYLTNHTNYSLYLTNHTNYSEKCESLNSVGDGIEKAKCYIDEGNLNMSLKICENLSSDKNACIGRLAIYLADKNINKSFYVCKNSLDYHTCSTNAVAVIASKNVSKAWELCNSVGHLMCNNLVVRVALSKNESLANELCNTYRWWYDKCQCYGTIFNTIVKSNANITQKESKLLELCNNVPEKCRDDYKIEVANMALQYDYKKAISICENVSFYGIDVCYLNIVVGVNKFNYSLAVEICNRINHEHEKNSCFSKI